MPQMSSMDWLLLMIYFMFIFYLFMILLYFIVFFSVNGKNLESFYYYSIKWY